jgi:hypothetical protein
VLAALLLAAPMPRAHELRGIEPIERKSVTRMLDAEFLAAPRAVSQRRIDYAMRQVVRTWNREYGGADLAFGFPQRDRLLDALQSRVPPDASLRLVAIDGWRVMVEEVVGNSLKTSVAVTARTRIEFTDASGRRQFREGVNEYHLTLEDLPP